MMRVLEHGYKVKLIKTSHDHLQLIQNDIKKVEVFKNQFKLMFIKNKNYLRKYPVRVAEEEILRRD